MSFFFFAKQRNYELETEFNILFIGEYRETGTENVRTVIKSYITSLKTLFNM